MIYNILYCTTCQLYICFSFFSALSCSFFTCIDLRKFLGLFTGSQYLTSDSIILDFTHKEYDPALSIHTCTKCIVLSTKIEKVQDLKMEIDILLQEKSFAMA